MPSFQQQQKPFKMLQSAGQTSTGAPPIPASLRILPWAGTATQANPCFALYIAFLQANTQYLAATFASADTSAPNTGDTDSGLSAFLAANPTCSAWVTSAAIERGTYLTSRVPVARPSPAIPRPGTPIGPPRGTELNPSCAFPLLGPGEVINPAVWNAQHPNCPPLPLSCQPPTDLTAPSASSWNASHPNCPQLYVTPGLEKTGLDITQAIIGAALVGGAVWFFMRKPEPEARRSSTRTRSR